MSDTIRAWQTGDELKIKTISFGTKQARDYTFKELNQEYGSRLFWRYVIVIVQQWPKVQQFIKDFREKLQDLKKGDGDEATVGVMLENLDSTISVVAGILPEVFTWDAIQELASMLLADHTVVVEDTTYVAGESGFSGIPGDPFELYNALFFAMCQNWPKYMLPLLGAAPDDLTRDSGNTPQPKDAAKS